MRLLGGTITAVLALAGAAQASPVSTLTPLSSNGGQAYGVYAFSEAGDTLSLGVAGSFSNVFCNHGNASCSGASAGQVFDLGTNASGPVFSLTDMSVANVYRTDGLGGDGFAHDLISATVDASDAAAIAAAYDIYGQGALSQDVADAISSLGLLVAGTSVTFVGWEDRLWGDFDYNDLIFAYVSAPQPPMLRTLAALEVAAVPEPATLALFGAGFAAMSGMRRRKRAK
jgi:hypothetical protein